MKALLILSVLILSACAGDKAHDPTAQAKALARVRGAGSCGHPETARALSAHKWCAVDRTAEDMETILFKLTDCSVLLSTTTLVIDQSGNESRAKDQKFDGSFYLDLDSSRPLHVSLKDTSPVYHTLAIAPDSSELTLTDVKYAPCAGAATEVEPEPETETEGGTDL